MSKVNQELFESKPKGVMEAIKEGIQTVAPGLSLSKMFSDVMEKGEQMWTQGRSEIAQALFTDGTAYVPYGPGQNPSEKDQGLYGPGAGPPEMERSGRSM